MSFRVLCPCGAKLSVKDELSGKQGKCPSCKRNLNLLPHNPDQRVEWQCPSCQRRFNLPVGNIPSLCLNCEKSETDPDFEHVTATVPENPPLSEIKTNTEFIRDEKPKNKSKSRHRKFVACAILIVAVAGLYAFLKGSKPSINPAQSIANSELQSAADDVIEFDARNSGIEVSAYYRGTFDKSIVVFDLQQVSGSKSRLDVFRVFLDFAEKLQVEYCEWVELAYQGDTKFKIEGSYFRELGRERNFQNPSYTIRTFPENLKTPFGSRTYNQWTGGILGVLKKQMDDFNDFHDEWYLDDMQGNFR